MFKQNYKGFLISTLVLMSQVGFNEVAFSETIMNAESNIEEIVVTATTREQTSRLAPASITVIGKESINQRFVDDLSDALSGSVGVNVTGVGQGRKGISLRGMPVQHTLYLLDGRRISSSNGVIAHSDFELGWLPTNAVERIEVVRGPMSSLYGSDALGGVINVITKVPSDELSGEIAADGTFLGQDGGGSYKLSAYLDGAIIKDKLSFSLSGQFLDRESLPSAEDIQISEIGGRKAVGGRAALIWTPIDGQRIDLIYSRNDDDSWRDTVSRGTYYQYRDDIKREQFALTYAGDWSWGTTKLNAYQSSLDRVNSRTNGKTATRPQSVEDNIIDGYVQFSMGSQNYITLGGQFREEKLFDTSAALSGVSSANHNSTFIQDEFQMTQQFSIVLGTRFDHHDILGWETSPRAYAVFEVNENFVVKGGYGQGFKAPSLTKISAEFQVLAAGGRFWVFGNPDLKPELSETFEITAQYDAEQWSLVGTLYQNNLNNLIETICTSDCGVRGQEIRVYRNVESARIKGIELAGMVKILHNVQLDANYSYTHAINLDTGIALNDRPSYKGNISLTWNYNDLGMVRLRSELIGRQNDSSLEIIPAYNLHHIDFTVPLSEGILLRGGIENILDERLAEKSSLYSLAEPGRQYRLGITVKF